MANIEVESRAFLSEDEYARLINFMESNAERVKDDEQSTFYLSGENDVRLQKNSSGAKIILKGGKIHDDYREEIEVKFRKEDFDNMVSILCAAELEIEIKWFRKRKEFIWKNTKVCIDRTKGYGDIIEIEILCGEDEVEDARKKISEVMSELEVAQTPRYVFEERFNYYKNNWRRLVGD
ncbi:MAG: CYTH domain-containing protein [DPANN group archaeon]|nr:CYTH domain-containing protein [DPANN group archaeon]